MTDAQRSLYESLLVTCENCNQGTGLDRGCPKANPTCPMVIIAKNNGCIDKN